MRYLQFLTDFAPQFRYTCRQAFGCESSVARDRNQISVLVVNDQYVTDNERFMQEPNRFARQSRGSCFSVTRGEHWFDNLVRATMGHFGTFY